MVFLRITRRESQALDRNWPNFKVALDCGLPFTVAEAPSSPVLLILRRAESTMTHRELSDVLTAR
jgi:hypothetical protein